MHPIFSVQVYNFLLTATFSFSWWALSKEWTSQPPWENRFPETHIFEHQLTHYSTWNSICGIDGYSLADMAAMFELVFDSKQLGIELCLTAI
ncbi:hypothetical protein U1Q18_045739 [Sarracenia purpurea var. burkii]